MSGGIGRRTSDGIAIQQSGGHYLPSSLWNQDRGFAVRESNTMAPLAKNCAVGLAPKAGAPAPWRQSPYVNTTTPHATPQRDHRISREVFGLI